MKGLIGTYECKIDVKGRFLFPADLKKQMLSVLTDGFILKRGLFNSYLELYPHSEWQKILNKLNSLNRFNKKNVEFIRRFTAGVRIVSLDTIGRLLLPKDLITFSGISKEIVLSSTVNMVEIWDKNQYESVVDNSGDDFPELAEEVMGGLDFSNDELS